MQLRNGKIINVPAIIAVPDAVVDAPADPAVDYVVDFQMDIADAVAAVENQSFTIEQYKHVIYQLKMATTADNDIMCDTFSLINNIGAVFSQNLPIIYVACLECMKYNRAIPVFVAPQTSSIPPVEPEYQNVVEQFKAVFDGPQDTREDVVCMIYNVSDVYGINVHYMCEVARFEDAKFDVAEFDAIEF